MKVRAGTSHRLAAVLAIGSAAAFVVTGLAVASGSDGAVPMAVLASVLGLTLKALSADALVPATGRWTSTTGA